MAMQILTQLWSPETAVTEKWKWREQAACKDLDPDVFFPDLRGATPVKKAEVEERALAVCSRCPVIRECADFAIEHEEENGTWGGYTEDELREIRRELRRQRRLERQQQAS